MNPKNDLFADMMSGMFSSSFDNPSKQRSGASFTPSPSSNATTSNDQPTTPDETDELSEQGRDVLGFFRVAHSIGLGKEITPFQWAYIYTKMGITPQDHPVITKEMFQFAREQARKDMKGKPGAALADLILDLFTDELVKAVRP